MTTLPRPTVRALQPLWSWLIPYHRRVIISPLPEFAVRSQLAAAIERMNATPTPSWLSNAVRYEGELSDDTFTLSGPIGNRRHRLETRGVIRPEPAGTRIDLTLQLATSHALLTLGQLGVLWVWTLIVHYPVALALFLSSFLYIGTILLVKYEASQIIRQIVQAAGENPTSEADGAIVADSVGWRCHACGGYVRRDATFCKHCKQRFVQ